MAQKKAEPMWLARDATPKALYSLSQGKPSINRYGVWIDFAQGGEEQIILLPAQSPVELPPGGGPVKVWLASERERAIAEAARMLVRSTKDGLDIVASGYYDEIAGLMEGEA